MNQPCDGGLQIAKSHKNYNPIIIEYLSQIRDNNNWVTCDCNKDVYKPVVMTICCKDETFYFSKVHSFNDHQSNCPFYRDASNSSQWEIEYIRDRKSIEFFGLYKNSEEFSQNNQNSHINDNSKNTQNSIGKLGRRLFALLEQSSLNQYSNDDFLLNESSFAKKFNLDIIKEVEKYQFSPNFGLKECFIYRQSLTFDDLYFLYDKLNSLELNWPKLYKKQGYVLFITDKIVKSEKSISIAGDRILNVNGSINFINGVIERSKNPGQFLVLMSVLYNSKRKYSFEPFDVFAAPIVSKNVLIPVESNYERIVFEKLV